MHVAAGTEIAAGAGDDDRLDVLGIGQAAKQVAQFGIGLERQRIFTFRPIQGQCCHAVLHREAEMGRTVGSQYAAIAWQLLRLSG